MDNEKTNDFSKGRLTQQVTEHERRINGHDKENDDMWKTINAIRNRPPVWCTVLIGVLLAALGYIVKAAIGS